MALLDSEGFGWTTSAADLTTYGAFINAGGGPSIGTNGPLGDNYLSSSYNPNTVRQLPSSASTFFFGCRLNIANSGTSPQLYFDDINSNNQISVSINYSNGVITAYRNGTSLGSATANIPSNGWFYCEVGGVISSTVGVVTCRINGATVLNLTGQNTLGNVSGVVQHIRVGYITYTSFSFYTAHWYFCDNSGSAPWNTYLGDVRVQTIVPTSNATVQFTPNPATITSNTGSPSGGNYSFGANTVYYAKPAVTTGGQIQTATVDVVTGFTGHLKMAIYSDSSGPNALLGSSAAITNPTTGLNTFTFTSGPTLANNANYWLAIVSDTSCSLVQNGSPVANYSTSQSVTYASAFPSTASFSAFGTSWIYFAMALAPANWNVAATIPPTPTTVYNSDSTVGNQDTFNTAGTAASTSTVYGLHHKGIYLKSTAGSRSMQSVLVSGVTTGSGTSTALGTSGVQVRTMFETDPNTSAQWTTTAANAAQPGYNVSA